MAIDDNTSYELTGAQVKDLASRINAKEDSADLAAVAESGSYNDLLDKPTIGNATLTIQKNGVDVATFTANSATNETANITVPTKTSDITNDSGFITEEDVYEEVCETGKTIAFQGAAPSPLASFQLDGETSQTGTPTPDAPVAVQTVTGENVVKICGKNLYNFRDITYKSGAFTADDDGWLTCTLNTAPSGNSDQAYYTHNLPLKNSTQYAVVLEVKSVSGSGSLVVHSRWAGNQEGQFTTEQAVNFSNLQAGKTYVYKPTTYASFNYDVGLRTYVRFAAGQTGSITFRISVLADTSITADTFDYEPYQGQSYTIGLFGSKNIFDKDNANIWNGYMGDASLTTAANARSLYIPVAAGQTYTFTRPNTTSQVNDFGYCFITDIPTNGKAYLDGRHIISSALTFTATAPVGAKYMLVYFAWNPSAEQLATILSGYQIEYGSTSSAYEAFQSLELCKLGNAQDYIFKSGDKWYVHKATGKLKCSDYTWSWDSSIPRVSLSTAGMGVVPPGGNQYPFLAYSNKFKADTFTHVYIEKNNGMAFSTSGFISLVDTSWTSQAEANSDIQDAVIYYALQIAYRTETEITNEALIEQLEAILSQGYTYAGTNNITTVISAGNAQGTLEICYTNTILPYATKDKPGIVQIGDGLSVDSNGVISSDGLTSVDWDDIDNKPTNVSYWTNDAGYITAASLPTVNNATLTIQKNGTTVNTFTANSSNNVTANIPVPTLSTTDTDPGEGSALAADTFLGVYDIAPTEIDGSRITNSTVTTNKLANGAVTAAKVDFSTFGVAATVNGPSSTTSKSNGAAWASTDMYTGSVTLAAGTYLVVVTGSSVAFSAGGEQEWFNITVDSTIVMTGSLAWLTDSVVGGNGVGIATVGTSGTHTVAYQLGAQGSRTCTLYSGSKIQFIRIG